MYSLYLYTDNKGILYIVCADNPVGLDKVIYSIASKNTQKLKTQQLN